MITRADQVVGMTREIARGSRPTHYARMHGSVALRRDVLRRRSIALQSHRGGVCREGASDRVGGSRGSPNGLRNPMFIKGDGISRSVRGVFERSSVASSLSLTTAHCLSRDRPIDCRGSTVQRPVLTGNPPRQVNCSGPRAPRTPAGPPKSDPMPSERLWTRRRQMLTPPSDRSLLPK